MFDPNTACSLHLNVSVNGFNVAFGNDDCTVVAVSLLLDVDVVVMPNFINNSNVNNVSFWVTPM